MGRRTLVLLASAAIVTACGGGGGSDSGQTPAPPTPTQPANALPQLAVLGGTSVASFEVVRLDGSASFDPDGSIATFRWEQRGGTAVMLADKGAGIAEFVAPAVTTPQTLTFALVATDNSGGTATKTTQISVRAATTSERSVRVLAVRFFQPIQPTDHVDSLPLPGLPVANAEVGIELAIAGPVANASFSLVDLSGSTLTPLKVALRGDSALTPQYYVGTVLTPSVPFRVRVTGRSRADEDFDVRYAKGIAPQPLNAMCSPAAVSVPPGATLPVMCRIENATVAGRFLVRFSDPDSLLSAPADADISLTTAQAYEIPLSLRVPIDFPAWSLATLTMNVTSEADSTVRNSALLEISVTTSP